MVQPKTVEGTLLSMLVENTGEHMLDSGGRNGRKWQENQKKVRDNQNVLVEDSEVSFDGEGRYTISVYHYLRQQLGLDDVCKEFNKQNIPAGDWESGVYGVSQKAYDWLWNKFWNDQEEGISIGESWNSYNGETNLSQVIQGTYLIIRNRPYVFLQIHGGCDIRGGYTDARLFTLEDCGYLAPENVYGTAKLDNEEYQISNTYDGCTLRSDDDDTELVFPEGAEVGLSLMIE